MSERISLRISSRAFQLQTRVENQVQHLLFVLIFPSPPTSRQRC